MAVNQLSLTWDDYQKNICNGLGVLQQRGEFVDMTLAADGHHVKVHQMVMSLVSPYIKELISSAQCPHPVIFLNNISHSTLNLILEYIYTGEVVVTRENVADLVAAGKALHIKGLKEMNTTISSQPEKDPIAETNTSSRRNPLLEKLQAIKENKQHTVKLQENPEPLQKIFVNVDDDIDEDQDMDQNEVQIIESPTRISAPNVSRNEENTIANITRIVTNTQNTELLYSLSFQGGLQLIVNRYLYQLRYVQKKLVKLWKCVEAAKNKCPAKIYTNDVNEIVTRAFTHNHPFHDARIVKKVRAGNVFMAYNEAASAALAKTTDDKHGTDTPPPAQDTDSE